MLIEGGFSSSIYFSYIILVEEAETKNLDALIERLAEENLLER